MNDWRLQKEFLEAQRSEAMAALNQSRASSRPTSAARGLQGSRSGSRPVSARPGTSGSSRPTSARPTTASRRPVSRPVSAARSAAQPVSPSPIGNLLPHPEDESLVVLQEEAGNKMEASLSVLDNEESFVLQEGGDDIGELLMLPALELEDSQELRRFMFPEEVVQALDDENDAALAAIRDEWNRLVRDTEERNKKKLEVLAR